MLRCIGQVKFSGIMYEWCAGGAAIELLLECAALFPGRTSLGFEMNALGPVSEWIGQNVSHYEIVEALGQGGMGVVYKARDLRLSRLVAVKVLGPEASNPDRISRFATEAKAASALNHPNIITIYEIGRTPAGIDYIVMEFIEGRTLRSLMSQPQPVSLVMHIGRQAAQALAVAHGRGIIHRDIKPENLMLRPDGYLKVLDFGLARLLEATGPHTETLAVQLTEPGTMLGTLAYMSPEQARGLPGTSASDIFGLGLVLYELATGRHSFSAGSPLALLHAIATEMPLPPTRLVPEMPPAVGELILRMLAKDPAQRPAASEVAEALSATDMQAAPVRQAEVKPAGKPRRTVGYEKERLDLRGLLRKAGQGEGLMVCVTGEPGIGKTTLVEDFLHEIVPEGWMVGRGRCSERLAGTDGYLPLLEALESLLHTSAGGQWARLLRTVAPTWYVQVASQADSGGDRLLTEVKGASQERMKREITAFFQEASAAYPLVLFFDDLHWADLSTVDILAYLGDRSREMRLLILGTYRPTDLLLSKHPFRNVQLELQARGACHEVPLGFLSQENVREYLDLLFAGHRFPAEFSGMVHSRTEGSPLFMVDLLSHLRDVGVIAPAAAGESWVLTQSVSDVSLGLPASVRSMIERKIERLSDEERRLLGAASVQGYQFDSAVLSKAMPADPADVEERLDHLDRVHGLVRLQGEAFMPDGSFSLRYRFVHVLYQNSLYDALRPTRRASLSASVAQALVACHAGEAEAIASELALLFEAARDHGRAIDFFALASQQAASVSANQEAIELAHRGLQLLPRLPAGPERSRRELSLQLLLTVPLMSLRGYSNPELEAAFGRAMELCRQSPDSIEIFQALTGLGAYTFFRPRLEEAMEILQRLLRMAESSPIPEIAGWVHFVATSVLSHAGLMTDALNHARRCLDTCDPSRHVSFVSKFGMDPAIVGRSQCGRVAALAGYPEEARLRAEEGAEAGRKAGHAFTLAFALFFASMVYFYRREPARCAVLAGEAEAIARDQGFMLVHALARVIAGWARAELGYMDEGITGIEEGLEQMRLTGCELFMPEFKGVLAELFLRRGQAKSARVLLEDAIAKAASTGERFSDAELYRLKGQSLAASPDGDAAAADAAFQEALAIARRQGCRLFELRAALALARHRGLQGPAGEERAVLAEITAWFTEGSGIADLCEARAFLGC